MIIKKLDIINFGKLKDKTLTLTDGLNIIYGRNESGKTTVSAFIETMLFGHQRRDGERKKYIPWSMSSSSGSITLEHDGDEVTIYRTLGTSPKSDEFKTYPENADLGFLPESRETYRRSIYTRESRASDFGSTAEIEKRLANMISSSDESLSATRAIDRLADARRPLKPLRGSSGKISKTEALLTDLENERYAALSARRRAEASENEIRKKESILSELYSRQKEYKSLNSEIISLKSNIDELNASIRSQEEYIASFPQAEGAYPSPPKLLSLRLLPYIICSLVLFIIGFALSSWIKFLFLVPLAVFAAVHLFLSKKARVGRKNFLEKVGCTTYDEYKKMLSDREDAVVYLKTLYREREKLIARHSDWIEKNSVLESINESIIKTKDEINELKASLITDNSRSIEEIDSDIAYYRAEKQSLLCKAEALDRAIEAIEYAKDRLSRDFTPKITEKAGEYISLIAPKEKREFHLEKDFSVSLTDPLPVDMSSCSFGLGQEIYICFRAALSEVIYGNIFPLIFDDPFLGSDDYREKSLTDLFASIAEKRQVIIFTNRKNSYFAQLDCNYIDISAENDV